MVKNPGGIGLAFKEEITFGLGQVWEEETGYILAKVRSCKKTKVHEKKLYLNNDEKILLLGRMCVSGERKGGDETGEVALNHVDNPEYYSYLGSLALS